jgi:hypothetical protein
MKRLLFAATALLLVGTSAAQAKYERTGPMRAFVCKGFIIQACNWVWGVETTDSSFTSGVFDKVDEYNEKLKICHVRQAIGSDFYEKTEEGYKLIRPMPENITFDCVKK